MSDLLMEALAESGLPDEQMDDPRSQTDAVVACTNPRLLTSSIRQAYRAREAKLAEPETGRLEGQRNEAKVIFEACPVPKNAEELAVASQTYYNHLRSTYSEAQLASDVRARRKRLSVVGRVIVGGLSFALAGVVGLGIGYGVEASGHPQPPDTTSRPDVPPYDPILSAPTAEKAAILGGTGLGALAVGATAAYAVGGIAARRSAKENIARSRGSHT